MTMKEHAGASPEYEMMREVLEPLARVAAALDTRDTPGGLPLFLLALDPWNWSVRFVQPTGAGDERLGAWLAERINRVKDAYQNLLPLAAHVRLAHDCENLVNSTRPSDAGRAAVHVLETTPLALGFATDTSAANWLAPGWSPRRKGANSERQLLIRFQDALDFGALADEPQDALRSLRARSRENARYSAFGPCTLKVPAYVARDGLVNPGTVRVFLAEYVYYRAAAGAVDARRPIDFYFMPLRAFGQWRASIDWLASTPSAPPKLDRSARLFLEEYYAASVSDLVARLVDHYLTTPGALDRSDRAWQAFVHLYWADAIGFWRNDQLVRTLERTAGGELETTARGPRRSAPRGSTFLQFRRTRRPMSYPTETWEVTLNLRALGTVLRRADPAVVNETTAILGFDRVVYQCRLIDGMEASRAQERWAALLAERLYTAVEVRTLRRRSALMHTFDAILHTGLSTLRSIAADAACEDFADGTPPTQLRYMLVRPAGATNGGLRDMAREEKLLDTLRRVWLGEAATAGALAFGRILANEGRIPDKLRATQEYSLADAIGRAELLMRGYDQSEGHRGFTVRNSADVAFVRLPKGYLALEQLANVFYELLLNGYRHSTHPAILFDVEVDSVGESVKAVVASCVGARLESSQWRTERGIAFRSTGGSPRDRFLFRLKDICALLGGGLDVSTRVTERDGLEWYETCVTLGELADSNGRAARPSVRRR